MSIFSRLFTAALAVVLGAQLCLAQGVPGQGGPGVPSAAPTVCNTGAASVAVNQPCETLGAQLRRLETSAKTNNPVVNPRLYGEQPWVVSSGAYPGSSQVVATGAVYTNSGNTYQAVTGGTTGTSTAPTGTFRGALYQDGTAYWRYIGFAVGDYISNNGLLFQVVTAGTPATTGSGPTPTSLTDGSIVWNYIGPQIAPVFTTTPTHNSSLTTLYSLLQSSAADYTLLVDKVGVGRFEGGWPTTNGINSAVNVMGPRQNPYSFAPCGTFGGNYIICNYEAVTVQCEAQFIELKSAGNQPNMSVIVDGRYLSPGAVSMTKNNSSNQGYMQLDFTNVGGRAIHRITFETQQSYNFIQVAVQPTDTCTYPTSPDNFGVAEFGSSLSIGTTASGQGFGWEQQFKYLAGLPDMATFGIGGTGVINPGSGPSTPIGGHDIYDLGQYSSFRSPVKLILIEAPVNDVSYSGSLITSTTTADLAALRAAYPNALILGVSSVMGQVNTTPGVAESTHLAADQAFSAAFTAWKATGDIYVGFINSQQLATGPIVSGSGFQNNGLGPCSAANISTTSGNSSLDGSNQSPHLMDCGYLLWARSAIPQYEAIIDALP